MLMKRFLLILLLFLSFNLIKAQSLVVTGNTYFTGSASNQITHHLEVKNIASKSITVICQKTYLSTPPTLPMWAGASYCFAGNCYASSSTSPSSPALLNAGQSISYANNDMDAFSGYYDPAETPGVTTVEYCFYDEINPVDQTCVVITYDCGSTSSIDENYKLTGKFYPNPTKDVLYFDYYLNKSADLIIMDVLGNQVSSTNFLYPETQKIDVSEFPKGIYFGSLVVDNQVLMIEKIIVK